MRFQSYTSSSRTVPKDVGGRGSPSHTITSLESDLCFCLDFDIQAGYPRMYLLVSSLPFPQQMCQLSQSFQV